MHLRLCRRSHSQMKSKGKTGFLSIFRLRVTLHLSCRMFYTVITYWGIPEFIQGLVPEVQQQYFCDGKSEEINTLLKI